MKQRLSLGLSATALVVAVLGATPLGHAAGNAALKGVPFAKKAGFATRAGFATKAGVANRAKNATTAANATHATSADDANMVNGIGASTTPAAGMLLPLGSDAKFPSSVIPSSGTPADVWKLSGNAGTTPGTEFLGTTDAQPLVVKTNGTEAMRIDAAGNVGVGTAGPGAKLEASSLGSGAIGLMATSDSRAVIGRLGAISCPGIYGVGGCAGTSGAAGVFGDSDSGVGVQGSSNTGRAVQGFSTSGIGVIGDSSTRGVIGTLGRSSCAGVYAIGGCGGAADGVLARVSTGTAVRAIVTDAAGSIFIGEAGTTRTVRIDNTGKGFFDGGTQTGGADYAESIRSSGNVKLEPGDVLAIDPRHSNTVRRSSAPSSQLVAGVYSTKPAVLAVGRHGVDDSLAGEVPVAMLGVVPTKVSAENGAVHAGDLLTTARTPGYAMKAKPLLVREVKIYPTGAILGKALDSLQHGKRVIKVLVNLR